MAIMAGVERPEISILFVEMDLYELAFWYGRLGFSYDQAQLLGQTCVTTTGEVHHDTQTMLRIR